MRNNAKKQSTTTNKTQVNEIMELEKKLHEQRQKVDTKIIELFSEFKEYQVQLGNIYNKITNHKNELQ